MPKLLLNDGMHPDGLEALDNYGIEYSTAFIPQSELNTALNDYDGIVVRSATKVRKDTIDANPQLQFIGRNGVGVDNIDVDYAKSKGIQVHNTPGASSIAVAELVIAQMLTVSRNIDLCAKEMDDYVGKNFKPLKKKCSKGLELFDKTIGIVGFGNIGQEVARRAWGMGMHVISHALDHGDMRLSIRDGVEVMIPSVSLEKLLRSSDFVTFHVPSVRIMNAERFSQLKKGVILINTARGEVLDEEALIYALDQGVVAAAALDVFQNEPTPNSRLLEHERIFSTPHIGAGTQEAQSRIGLEMAGYIIDFFKN